MTVTNTVLPVISGSAVRGSTLSTSNGTWTFSLDYLSYTYQWERCDAGGASCVDIGGATNSTYSVQNADVGSTIRVKVTATEHSFAPGGPITIAPPQPGAVIYGSDAPSSYYHSGAMVDMNSSETPGAIAVSNAGGHVLVYVDIMITGSGGNYASLINNANVYGPAIGRWPGQTTQYNSYGYVRDIVTLVNSGKLLNILNKVVADNPHMAGFFADDLGTTNPQYKTPMIASTGNGYTVPTTTFYNAVIAATQVFRDVCDAHRLILCVNGGFDGRGTGGYPVRGTHGCSLAESQCAEHQTNQGTNFWPVYLASTQWANDSPITMGETAHFVIATPGDHSWDSTPGIAWIAQQSTYSSAPAPWTGFHTTGLPTYAS